LKHFSPKDCFPVTKFERIHQTPMQFSFARDGWGGSGLRPTFAEILRRPMADGGRQREVRHPQAR
jgi:hypothetical protein